MLVEDDMLATWIDSFQTCPERQLHARQWIELFTGFETMQEAADAGLTVQTAVQGRRQAGEAGSRDQKKQKAW